MHRLSSQPLLRDIPPSAQEALLRYATHHRLERGSPVPSPDDTLAIFLVVGGSVRFAVMCPDGSLCTLELLQPGDLFTLDAAWAGGTMAWVARALQDGTLVDELPEALVVAALVAWPALALAVVREQHRRLTRAYARLGDLAGAQIRVRLAQALGRLAREDGAMIELSHDELGWLVGASRARVTAALAQLSRQGLVAVARHRRGLRALDAVALRQYGRAL